MPYINIRVKGSRIEVSIAFGSIIDAEAITILINKILKIARSMFVIGPAAAEIAMPLLGSLKFIGLIGTGFAYPKTGCPKRSNNAGIIIVPSRSICAIGLRVSLPINLAVGSPSLFATKPCETSWNVIAMSIGSADIANCLRIFEISNIVN
jgi:hypothetical protein